MEDNKIITSMLFKFAHSFLVIGAFLTVAFTLLVGWNIEFIGLLTGLGFILASVLLYVFSAVLSALFSFETNLKMMEQRTRNNTRIRPLWK